MHTLATTITKIFNPTASGLATILVVILVQQISLSQKVFWSVVGLLVAAVPLAVFLAHVVVADRAVAGTDKNLWHKLRAIYLGNTPSFWSPEGWERVRAFWAWVVVALIYTVLAYLFDAPRLVTALGLVFLILGIINLIASSSFKISVHSEMISLFALTAILAVSVNLIYLVLLIPLVGWARIYLKVHTISEVSLGTLTSVLAVYLVFAFFGLATF